MDKPVERNLAEHPCYGFFKSAPNKLSHRAYITNSGPIYCERCGTELDVDKKQLVGTELRWSPRPDEPPSARITDDPVK